MRIFKIISGICVMILGLAAIVFAWLFFYTDEEAMIIFAALLVSLLIGAILVSVGMSMFLIGAKKENKDE